MIAGSVPRAAPAGGTVDAEELSYPVLIVALLVPAVGCTLAVAVVRCRRAGRLIDRILAEELGPQRATAEVPALERRAERIT
jgi:hypothetical protein